jgi:hypothetical protein
MANASTKLGLKAKTHLNIKPDFSRSPKVNPTSKHLPKHKLSLKAKVKPLLKPASEFEVKTSRKTTDALLFPAPDPIRPAFCCPSVIPTSHPANIIPHRYLMQILGFTAFMKQVQAEKVIPVKDYTWGGLEKADFILELKRGTIIKQERVTRSSNVKQKHGGEAEGTVERDITFGAGRYFVMTEEETGGFVEVLINDGKVSWEFENVLGVCKEFVCAEKEHEDVVFQIEVWEGVAALEKYYK